MLTHEQRLKIYGGAERLAEADRLLDELVANAPPLTSRQKDTLRQLLAKPAPAATVLPLPRPVVLAA
ncbi:MAG TPA: hypothetical protein VGX23_33785 [Actinocrinis sp.]|nr:hypothetical protein [Actinocrinis sp.]